MGGVRRLWNGGFLAIFVLALEEVLGFYGAPASIGIKLENFKSRGFESQQKTEFRLLYLQHNFFLNIIQEPSPNLKFPTFFSP
jgi:hypothetical protein